jgi:ADP-ribose pyrophosphatase YjhB (NUDIX family)
LSNQIPRVIVGALIFDNQQRIFLMRSSGKFGDQWIIPGGKVDYGETVLTALLREIREETNLEIKDIKFVGIRELIEPQKHFVFLEHTAIAINTENIKLNSEATEFGWFAKSDLNTIDIAEPTLALIQERWG